MSEPAVGQRRRRDDDAGEGEPPRSTRRLLLGGRVVVPMEDGGLLEGHLEWLQEGDRLRVLLRLVGWVRDPGLLLPDV